jgi:hypothetical protein
MAKELEFRTLEEFKMHYFPKAVKKEEMEEIYKDPGKFGEYLAQEMMKIVRRNLASYNPAIANQN